MLNQLRWNKIQSAEDSSAALDWLLYLNSNVECHYLMPNARNAMPGTLCINRALVVRMYMPFNIMHTSRALLNWFLPWLPREVLKTATSRSFVTRNYRLKERKIKAYQIFGSACSERIARLSSLISLLSLSSISPKIHFCWKIPDTNDHPALESLQVAVVSWS